MHIFHLQNTKICCWEQGTNVNIILCKTKLRQLGRIDFWRVFVDSLHIWRLSLMLRSNFYRNHNKLWQCKVELRSYWTAQRILWGRHRILQRFYYLQKDDKLFLLTTSLLICSICSDDINSKLFNELNVAMKCNAKTIYHFWTFHIIDF